MPCNCFNFSEVSRLHISGRLQHSALGVMMGLRKLNRRLATVAMGHNGQFGVEMKQRRTTALRQLRYASNVDILR